ncbi:hypothetical protein PZH38_15230, partial [[Ruminococcus] lactaris]|nr:hypothetical protein [[Ruminococcus] lactaris]
MAESRQDELYDALQLKGYPEDFCREIAYRQMNTILREFREVPVFFISFLESSDSVSSISVLFRIRSISLSDFLKENRLRRKDKNLNFAG